MANSSNTSEKTHSQAFDDLARPQFEALKKSSEYDAAEIIAYNI